MLLLDTSRELCGLSSEFILLLDHDFARPSSQDLEVVRTLEIFAFEKGLASRPSAR